MAESEAMDTHSLNGAGERQGQLECAPNFEEALKATSFNCFPSSV